VNHLARRLMRVAKSLGLVTGLMSPAVLADGPELVTNVSRFEIPFELELSAGEQPEGFAVLFGSQDDGATWHQLQSVPAAQGGFPFVAARDGRYAFAIRMTDEAGNLLETIDGSAPELEIIVDTVAPDLQLQLLDGGPGQVLVSWTIRDAAADLTSLKLEYADAADGRWRPVPVQAAASGQARLPASPGSVISVRGSVDDAAGNRGEAGSQLVCSSPASRPDTVLPGATIARPLGPSPFETLTPSSIAAPAMGSMLMPSQADMSGSATGSADGTALPQSVAGGTEPALPAGATQLVGARVFDLDYQVEEVGPSGVSAVELFVTEDGGRQWFRYGPDDDARSPVTIEVPGDGSYGFAVRARNGLGFSDLPPQPGQLPEIVVVVDQTAPVIELSTPAVTVNGNGQIAASWRVSDPHAADSPVRLEQAPGPDGPWTTVFDWQSDPGSHQWPIQSDTPGQLYLRLLARDAAGNIGFAQNSQPLIVDTRKPVARFLRVHPASHALRGTP
jgi:hypothetical protein